MPVVRALGEDEPTRSRQRNPSTAVLTRLLAGAVFFHMASLPFAIRSLPPPAHLTAYVVATVCALQVLRGASRQEAWFVGMTVAVVASVAAEAPVVGNHWVLAGLLALSAALSCLVPVRRGRSEALLMAVRGAFVVFYGFAAWSKLNTAFLDPTVSCAVLFQDSLVRSWGLGALSAVDRPAGIAVVGGAVVVELTVAALLAVRGTRRAGALLGLSFHWLLAMDASRHFWDFSAVLLVGFVAMLPDGDHARLVAAGRALRRRIRVTARRVLSSLLLLTAALMSLPPVVLPGTALSAVSVVVATIAWWVYGTFMLALVARIVWRARGRAVGARPLRARLQGSVPGAMLPLLLLPTVLSAANGLAPYLELKTGFSWNMYSNLVTVDGRTNHLLVARTWPVWQRQSDRVLVIESSDPALDLYDGFELVWSEFQTYARDNPEQKVVYERSGQRFMAETLFDDPASIGQSPWWERSLVAFRPVAADESAPCVTSFGPAN